MLNRYKDWAQHYIDKGISVIPDKGGSKQPAIKGWTEYCNRMPTDEELKQWYTIDHTNISVALGKISGVIALDLDTEDTQVLDIIRDYMPPSPVERIGSKGWVRFFRYNGEPSELIKFNGKVALEVLSSGKKVTIPPSLHPDGMTYKWSDQDLLNVDVDKLPYLPPMLIDSVKSLLRFNDKVTVDGNKIINGRFDALQSECGKLIKNNVALDQAVKQLVDFDLENHEEPYFEDHTEQYHTEPYTNALKMYVSCLDSFNKRHMEKSEEYEIPVTASAVNDTHLEEVLKKKEPQKETSEKEGEPLTDYILTEQDGVLYDIQKFILSNSFIKQPGFALSAALGFIGTLIGRKVTFSGNASNLYILNVAPSGAGKDAPQQCIKKLFIDLRLDGKMGSGDYVSDASLMDTLPERPVRLDIVDEASGLLKSVNKGGNTFDGKMADILCELYTSSNSRFLGRTLAGGDVKGACDRPCVSLMMSTTPRGFEESITIKAVEKGLLGRTLIFRGNPNNRAERVASYVDISERAKTHLREMSSYEPPVDTDNVIGDIKQKVMVATTTEDAAKRLDDIFLEFDNMRRSQKEDSLQLPIIARMFQQLCKLALIRSVSRNLDFEVNKGDVEFAYKLVVSNLKNFTEMLEQNICDHVDDKYINKVVKYLKNNGPRDWGRIRNGVRHSNLSPQQKRGIIKHMVETGILQVAYQGNNMNYYVGEEK